MKRIKILGVFVLLAVIASIIPLCQATIEKEYTFEVKHLLHNDVVYVFKVKLVIETEENGAWIKGKDYTITFTLTVDFINFTYLDALNFSDWYIYRPGEVDVLKYHDIGYKAFGEGESTLSYPRTVAKFEAYPKHEGRIAIFPGMFIKAINPKPVDGSFTGTIGNWKAEEPLYIDITTKLVTTQIDEIKNLIYVLISTIIILIAVTCYLTIKKTKV